MVVSLWPTILAYPVQFFKIHFSSINSKAARNFPTVTIPFAI